MSYEYSTGASGSIYIPVVSTRAAAKYDYKLGPKDRQISYMLKNHRKQIQIGGEACYILRRKESGSAVPAQTIPVFEEWEDQYDSTYYRSLIWDGQGLHPDFRTYTAVEESNTPFDLANSGSSMDRIVDYKDLKADTEFALYEDKSVLPHRWFVVFNGGFDPRNESLSYTYSTLSAGTDVTNIEPDEDSPEYFGSKFGWIQMTTPKTQLTTTANQFLIRLPMTLKDIRREQQGFVINFEPKAWMLGEPYVKDMDVIVRPAKLGIEEERYEVLNKEDSIVKSLSTPTVYYRSHQKFQLKLIDRGDSVYNIPIIS